MGMQECPKLALTNIVLLWVGCSLHLRQQNAITVSSNTVLYWGAGSMQTPAPPACRGQAAPGSRSPCPRRMPAQTAKLMAVKPVCPRSKHDGPSAAKWRRGLVPLLVLVRQVDIGKTIVPPKQARWPQRREVAQGSGSIIGVGFMIGLVAHCIVSPLEFHRGSL